jgi:hypothetical protein
MWRILGGIISQLPPATRQYQPQERERKGKGKAVTHKQTKMSTNTPLSGSVERDGDERLQNGWRSE